MKLSTPIPEEKDPNILPLENIDTTPKPEPIPATDRRGIDGGDGGGGGTEDPSKKFKEELIKILKTQQ